MRGLDRSEKEILVSIGQIVDIAVNNRTPTNPTGTIQKSNQRDPRLPSVSNLAANSGVRSVKLTWSPVDGSILDSYSIKITNMDTGETTDGTSYTSNFTFKGESGNYKAVVKSVGRNGVASPVKTIVFTIADSVMILEGAKNGVSTESPFVSEVVLTPADYTVFAWASFTLNSFSSPVQNSPPIVDLLYGDDLNTATLIQSITLFPESESLTNLNDLDYNLIGRPSGGATRVGNFETANSIMFAPFDVPDSIANRSTRFWVNVTNRNTEADVISLSIVLWVGSGGRGELGVTPVVNSVNPRSIDLDGLLETMAAVYDETSGEMEDSFTISMWVKPIDLSVTEALDNPTFFIFAPTDSGFQTNRVWIRYLVSPPNFHLEFFVFNQNSFGTTFVVFDVAAPTADGTSTIFTNGENEWNLLTATWDRLAGGAARLNLYMNGVLFTTGGSLTVSNSAGVAGDIARSLPNFFFTDYDIATGISSLTFFNPPRARYNMMGIWSTALAANEIAALYNGGAGGAVDWRNDTGNYVSSANLIHYWLFGFNTASSTSILDDYGNSSFALINLSDNAVDITAGDDVVTDTPPVA